MKKLGKIFIIIALCGFGLYLATSKNEDKKSNTVKTLFIGNSYTYAKNIPSLVHQIARENKDNLEYRSHIAAAAKISDHLHSQKLESVFAEKEWDFVVVQAQSTELIQSDEQFEKIATIHMQELVEKIQSKAPHAEILLFGTWASKDGRPDQCKKLPHMCNFSKMNAMLTERQVEVSKDTGITLVPITKTWSKIRSDRQNINLYDNDGSHPSYYGAYLSALHFYSYLFRKKPTSSQHNISKISEADEQFIKESTEETFHEYYGENFFQK